MPLTCRNAGNGGGPQLMRRMPNLNCELAGPAGLGRRAGGLASNKTRYRHGMLGELDLVDPKPHLADDLQAYGIEQPPDLGHYDAPRRAGMRGQPIRNGHQATKQFRPLGANGHIEVLRSRPGFGREALLRGQPSAAAPDADDCVIPGPGYRITQHAPRLVEELLRPRDRGDHRRRRARDKLWPQHARLGVVFILNLLSGGARHYVENVIPGDHRLHGTSGIEAPRFLDEGPSHAPLSQGEPTRDSPIFQLTLRPRFAWGHRRSAQAGYGQTRLSC